MSEPTHIDAYTTVPRAAAMLGIKPTKMHDLLDRGEIPYLVPGKQRRVRIADVLEYRNRRTRRGNRPKLTVTEDLLTD